MGGREGGQEVGGKGKQIHKNLSAQQWLFLHSRTCTLVRREIGRKGGGRWEGGAGGGWEGFSANTSKSFQPNSGWFYTAEPVYWSGGGLEGGGGGKWEGGAGGGWEGAGYCWELSRQLSSSVE